MNSITVGLKKAFLTRIRNLDAINEKKDEINGLKTEAFNGKTHYERVKRNLGEIVAILRR